MGKDYTNGRYNLLMGRGPMAPLVGRIDHDEFVRSDTGQLLYRIDGQELYDMAGKFLGDIVESDNSAMVVTSDASGVTCHFLIVEE